MLILERITELRKSKHLSKKQLGEIIGFNGVNSLSEIEHGRSGISIEKLEILADYFDVSLDWLMGRTDNPQSHKT
jgi:transcriptional regulator with XRE-family HTH domain